MKKLKTKITGTIFIILSISIVTILTIYNSTIYIRERNNIEGNLNNMMMEHKEMPKERFNEKEDMQEPPEIPNEKDNPRFMDVTMYTIELKDKAIEKIINHTNDEETPDEITEIAEKIIKTNKEEKTHIGNLFLEKYSYRYTNNKITIINNSETNKLLQLNLGLSILIFLIFEGISYIISISISKWIIKPVEQSFNKQKQFIADASHELKTPLAVIMASSEAYESDKKEKWIKNIQSESNRMSNLIKNLLDLAKLDNDELPITLEVNNLSKTVEMAIVPLESLIYEKNIELKYEIEDKIEWKYNADEIKQLIGILLDNAIKHSKDNGKITVVLKKEKDNVLLKVTNLGDPIPKGEEEKIFERFYRIDKARNRSENRYGLGLAIAKSIVERHKGIIKAYSNNNKTTFEIVLKK